MKKLLMSALMLGAFGLSFAGNPIKDGEPEKKESTSEIKKKEPFHILKNGWYFSSSDGEGCSPSAIGCIGMTSRGFIVVNIYHSDSPNPDDWFFKPIGSYEITKKLKDGTFYFESQK